MPGPKYGSFDFPSDFGFTGSAGQVHVKPHVRRFAKGGKVTRRPPLKPSPEQIVGATLAAGAAAAAYDKLRRRKTPERLSVGETVRGGVRRQREKDLGLRQGGKVRYAKGGGAHRMLDGSMMKDSAMKSRKGMKDC